jgi:CPA1 family monovalent cation:H+ antiporter
VLATRVAQGLTLRWLMRRLGLRDDGMVAEEVARARAETNRAALTVLEAAAPEAAEAATLLQAEYAARLHPAEGDDLAALQRQAVAAQRKALAALRRRGEIGDDAFHQVEEEIDLLDLTADPRIRCLPATPG